MRNSAWIACAVAGVLASGAYAPATPWWLEYDPGSGLFPEQAGWTRLWGDHGGPYHGAGANRTQHDGVLTYDSLYDPSVYDFSYIQSPGWKMDPDPGEQLVIEWSVYCEQVADYYDPGVGFAGDGRKMVGFGFSPNSVISVFEGYTVIPVAPGVFHDYRLTSSDMSTYQLFIDGELARVGTFWDSATSSYASWGDGVQGDASLHHWRYFRLGVVPEPLSLYLLAVLVACCGRRR